MASMIEYRGQLYKRVDSGAPKIVSYKGQMFRRVDTVSKENLKHLLEAEIKNEVSKRLHNAKGFKRLSRFEVYGNKIEFVADCAVRNNHDIDDDERNRVLDAFIRNVNNAFHGFAKVNHHLDGYTMGDDGTSTTEPVALEGNIDANWLKTATQKITASAR